MSPSHDREHAEAHEGPIKTPQQLMWTVVLSFVLPVLIMLRTGEQVYQAQCTACHAVGAAGAPKTGDEAAWAPRIKTGYDALLNSVVKGKGAMAAQSGGEFSDFELGRAVVYMVNKAGGKMDEPKAPASAASAPEAAASK